MTTLTKNYVLLHFIVFIWGFTASLGLLIDLPSLELVLFRTLIAAIALMIVIFFNGISFKLHSMEDFYSTIIVGFLIALHWITFFLSAKISNASVSLVGLATCSFWTSLIEPYYFKKKIKIYEVVLGLVAMLGIALIFKVNTGLLLGLVVGVLSSLFAAIFSVINSRLTKINNHFTLAFYEMTFAFISVILFLPFYVYFFADSPLKLTPSPLDWFYLFILATICTVFAFSFSIKIMQNISAFSVNLIVNLEPLYGILIALMIFKDKELMSMEFYIGGSIVLLSTLSYPIINKWLKRKSLETDIFR